MKRKGVKYDVGDFVGVRFLDHAQNSEKPMEFILYGLLTQDEAEYVTVECWRHADERSIRDSNCEWYVILKSAILGVEVFVRRDDA